MTVSYQIHEHWDGWFTIYRVETTGWWIFRNESHLYIGKAENRDEATYLMMEYIKNLNGTKIKSTAEYDSNGSIPYYKYML